MGEHCRTMRLLRAYDKGVKKLEIGLTTRAPASTQVVIQMLDDSLRKQGTGRRLRGVASGGYLEKQVAKLIRAGGSQESRS